MPNPNTPRAVGGAALLGIEPTPAHSDHSHGLGIKGKDIASAAALRLGPDGSFFHITGTTTITSISTRPAGDIVVLEFDGALTLTHNATSLILSGGANRTTAAGDVFAFVSEGGGNWRELSESIASGTINKAFVTIGNDGTLTAERALTGTPNQAIITDNGAGSTVVISLPQNIHTGASPTFDGMNLTTLRVNPATNQNLRVGAAVSLAGSIALSASNDANSANVPMELRGTTLHYHDAGTLGFQYASVGGLKLGATTARGTTEPTGALTMFNGTAPVGTLVNGGTFYVTGGVPTVMDASGNANGLGHGSSPTFTGLTLSGDLAINGGDLTSTATTFNLLNATVTTLNIGGASTTTVIGPSGGKVGIGVTPVLAFQVRNASNIDLAVGGAVGLSGAVSLNAINDNNSANIPLEFRGTTFQYYDGGTLALQLKSDGLYLQSTSTNNQFSNGSKGAGTTTMYIGNASINVTSDRRLKSNIEPSTLDALGLMSQLSVVDHEWNDPSDRENPWGKRGRGRWRAQLTAQDVVDFAPWLVNAPDPRCPDCKAGRVCIIHDTYWGLDTAYMAGLFVKGFQELAARVAALEDVR